MKTYILQITNVVCITAALLLNIACAPTGTDGVWQNSDYGSGKPPAGIASLKPSAGFAILNGN